MLRSIAMSMVLAASASLLIAQTKSSVWTPSASQTMKPDGTLIFLATPYVVPLSDIGIADARFLNPRNPPSIVEQRAADKQLAWRGLVFDNRTVDRTFVVSLKVILRGNPAITDMTNRLKWVRDTYFKNLAQCKNKDASGALIICAAELTVYRGGGGSAFYPATLLGADQTPGFLREFQVRFFDEQESPSNAKGYFRTDLSRNSVTGKYQPIDEPESTPKLTPVASVGLNVEPLLDHDLTQDSKPAILSPDHPLSGQRRTHFPGAARLDVTENIGNRANADLSFAFNSADFGDQTEKGNLVADKYKLSIYALNGITLDFGKYVFATPASKVAINEKGQGFTLTFPNKFANVAVAYVIKRQGDSTVSSDQGSAADSLVQVSGIDVANISRTLFRTLNLIALSGRDEKPADRHVFSTFGGELFFAGELPRHSSYGGSLAVFHSVRSRSEIADLTTLAASQRHGHGSVGLLRSTWNPEVQDRTGTGSSSQATDVMVSSSFSATIGAGSAAHDTAGAINTGYVGEHAAFTPDLIFLSGLANPLTQGKTLAVGPGLANKLYYSVEYANNNHSLLEAFAAAFGIDPIDIASKSTKVSVSRYRMLNSSLGTRDLGSEVDLQFQIETPKAVRVSLNGGYFVPSQALRSSVKRNVWLVTTGVSIAP